MVQITLTIRPLPGYNAPKNTKTVTVDTSDRVEAITQQIKVTKKGTRFFDRTGRELPLNSSLASNNVQNGDFLEGCAAPKLSAVLSAVLRDLTEVEKIPELERTESRLRTILDVDGDKKDLLEPFPDRWSNEDIKTRKIALATMKKIIQRMDRYEDQQVPHIDNLQALCDFVHPILQRSSSGRGYNSMIHVVKPTSRNRDGLPTTCFVLLQRKLDQMNSIVVPPGSGSDIIEEFIKIDYARHNNGRQGTPGSATPRSRGRSGGTPSSTPGGRNTKRVRRNLQLDATENVSSNPSCCSSGCVSIADSVCLDAGCPFQNQIFCLMCFSSNHPLSIRNHERVDLKTDPRGKRVLKQQTQSTYIPEFASGPYAILATLMEMSSDRINPEHSLTESRLKKLSQQRCRSNLYDNQAQGGRNAFAAAENLAEKNFLRKEIIPGVHNSEAKFSLLPTGEAMGKLCLAFEKGLKTALYPRSMLRQRSLVLTQPTTDGISTSRQKEIKLIIDSREDAQYINRLTELLSENQIQYDRRDLPSGDYLYVTQDGNEERVLPMIVERKTWSDLADSVMGRGQRRLDCVRIGSAVGNSCQGNRCQLCRMKRSGCSKRMFIIEGHRCLGRDGEEEKCSPAGYCRYCRELLQRHGPEVVQMNLEKNVLERLQCEHGCIIHFTDGFNETISSLLTLHRLLGSLPLNITESNLTYQQFCTNSRSASASSGVPASIFKKGECVVLAIEEFARRIHEGKGPSSILGRLDTSESIGTTRRRPDDDVIVLDDSDDETQKKPPAIARSTTKKAPARQDLIVLDSDSSDEDGDEVEAFPRNKDDDDVIILDDLPPVRRLERPKKKKSSTTCRSTKLVIIKGLLEYDTEYKKDTNTVWKALYKTHESHGQNELENVAAQKLKSICDQAEASPLVPREYLQFWSLYFQVFNQDVRIHFTRGTEGLESLRSSWLDRRQRNTSLGSTSSIDSAVNNRQRSPSRRLDFDDNPSTKCMVCESPVIQDKLTTKCGHTFHQHCLRAWFDASNTRKCPQCNVDGIGLPKESDNRTGTTSSTSGRKRKNPPGNESSRPPRVPVPVLSNSHRPSSHLTTDSAIRAARLRRFEGGAATPTPVVSSSASSSSSSSSSAYSSWDCPSCTLINNGTLNTCGACEAPRPGFASSRSSDSFSQHPPSVAYPSYGGAYSTPSSSQQQQQPSASNRSGSSTGGKTRQIRCGACKQVGHNRSNATASNCTAFYDPEEVEMRRKKAEEAQRKARELRNETRQREDAMRNQHAIEARRDEELRRLLEENQRKTAEVNRLQAEETKRLEKKAKAAERRARKLRENNNH